MLVVHAVSLRLISLLWGTPLDVGADCYGKYHCHVKQVQGVYAKLHAAIFGGDLQIIGSHRALSVEVKVTSRTGW